MTAVLRRIAGHPIKKSRNCCPGICFPGYGESVAA